MSYKDDPVKVTEYIYEKKLSQFEDLCKCGNSYGTEPSYEQIKGTVLYEFEINQRSLFEIMNMFGFSQSFCRGFFDV